MAVLSTGTLNLRIETELQQMARLQVPLLAELAKFSTSQTQIRWNASVGGATVAGQAVTADIGSDSDDNVRPASLPIGAARLHSSFLINNVTFTQAASVGQGELANLLRLEAQAKIREILKELGGRIYNGNGSTAQGGILGFNQLHSAVTAEKATNAYAGINPADAGNALWTTFVRPTVGALTIDKMRSFASQLQDGSVTGVPSFYTHVAMNSTTLNWYLQAVEDVYEVSAAMGSNYDPANFRHSFDGRPIVPDPNCPAGTIYFLNADKIGLYSFNEESPNGGMQEQEEEGLLYYVREISTQNPQARRFSVYGMYQLAVKDRSAVAAMTDVLAPA